MSNTDAQLAIAINTDLTNDLNYQIMEVKRLFSVVKQILIDLDTDLIEDLDNLDSYVDNLKSRIEILCYESIYRLSSQEKELMQHYKALVRIANNIERVADHMVQAGKQVGYLNRFDDFLKVNLQPYFELIDHILTIIHQAFTEADKGLAEEICASEKTLDEYYYHHFQYIQKKISNEHKSGDMITLLFIVRYFERIGDCFLNIGEGILNIAVGDALSIKHYRKLEAVVSDLSKTEEETEYLFKPFLFSRSGCKVGKLIIDRKKDDDPIIQHNLFYKQGDQRKIEEEIQGLKFWKKQGINICPKVVWKQIDGNYSTLVVEHLKGENMLNYVLGDTKLSEIKTMASHLCDQLDDLWSDHKQKKSGSTNYIQQIIKRQEAITNVHEDFFEEFLVKKNKTVNFKSIFKKMGKLEKRISYPFQVPCHGDFNLDNILFNKKKQKCHFIDVHRSKYSDYAQEISVFIVSMLRIKLKDKDFEKKQAYLISAFYEFGKKFAEKHQDEFFEARLAFGIFRSLITSTRFVYDDGWYKKMRSISVDIFDSLVEEKGDLKSFNFNIKLLAPLH